MADHADGSFEGIETFRNKDSNGGIVGKLLTSLPLSRTLLRLVEGNDNLERYVNIREDYYEAFSQMLRPEMDALLDEL